MFDGAIKAQWSDHCFVVLFKAAKLDFFACPSTDRAMLLGFMDAIERRLSEALNQTDESDDEETEEEDDAVKIYEQRWFVRARRLRIISPTVVFSLLLEMRGCSSLC